MNPIFVTATGTDVGKTHMMLTLIEKLSKRGMNVGVYKPVETGVDEIPEDANKLLARCQRYNAKFADFTTDDIVAYTFPLPAAPFCADIKGVIEVSEIVKKAQKLQLCCDILLIEGAGGLMVPITKDYTMMDLCSELKADILLVTPDSLGCINETVLSIEMVKKHDFQFDWCVNLRQSRENFEITTRPYYDVKFPNWWSIDNGLDTYLDRLVGI